MSTENTFVKELLQQKLNEQNEKQTNDYYKQIQKIIPNITIEQAIEIYQLTISFRQSKVSKIGKLFENILEELFIKYNIKYRSQVSINLENETLQSGKKSPVVDFVIGEGENLKDLIIISCKYTCRERAKEDDWSIIHKPKKYFLVVATDDYPTNFKDTSNRKLFVLESKKEQKRLNIDDLLTELTPITDFNNTSNTNKTYRFVDLCCGIGSFHLSMGSRGRCVMACDILQSSKLTYKENYGIDCLDDLTKIDYTTIDADIIFSGNPCQSFSNIGKREGLTDARGDLFNFIIDNIIALQKYKIVVFENVDGLTTHDNGETFKYLLSKIKALNYNVLWRVLLCSDYGIPQNRRRVFIICFRSELKHNKKLFDSILEKHKSIVSLTDYMNKPGKKFKKTTAYTIRCGGFHSPIDSKQNWDGYILDDDSEYRLTVDDMKHLQGFPSDFKLVGTTTEQRKLLGNTIPTNLTKIICEYITKILDEKYIYKEVLHCCLLNGELSKNEYEQILIDECLTDYE